MQSKEKRAIIQGGKEEPMAEKKQSKIIAQNKKAFHDYFVDERFEAGIG